MNKKIVVAISIALVALISSLSVWYLYRYETTVLSLTYETSPIMSSPLSDANYSWEAKVYSAQVFGNSPFDGKGFVHRERITSENRFRNTEFHNLNVTLRLRFQIANATGYVLCNETIDTTDGCDRQVIFEFRPESAKAGNALQIRITLSLSVNYDYGTGREPKQFTLQKEWARTIQIHQTEPATEENF